MRILAQLSTFLHIIANSLTIIQIYRLTDGHIYGHTHTKARKIERPLFLAATAGEC